MNEAQKRETFHAAIELLVERAVTKSRPDNAGAYSATVRADLSTRYRDAARDMYRQHGELTADELAEILEPSTPVRVERKRTALDAEIEANAERLKALPDRTPTPLDEAKRRLEAMRSTLRAGIQKLTPEQENTTHA